MAMKFLTDNQTNTSKSHYFYRLHLLAARLRLATTRSLMYGEKLLSSAIFDMCGKITKLHVTAINVDMNSKIN